MTLDHILDITDYSIILPCIIGMVLFNKIEKSFRYLILVLIAGFANELFQFVATNAQLKIIAQVVYLIIHFQLYLALFFSWDNSKRSLVTRTIIHSCFFIIAAFNVFYSHMHMVMSMVNMGLFIIVSAYAMYVIHLENCGANSARAGLSRKLIIIPFIVFNVYFVSLQIVIFFLYDALSEDFFVHLFYVIRFINILTYISYSLGIKWAPKKETYL